MNTEN